MKYVSLSATTFLLVPALSSAFIATTDTNTLRSPRSSISTRQPEQPDSSLFMSDNNGYGEEQQPNQGYYDEQQQQQQQANQGYYDEQQQQQQQQGYGQEGYDEQQQQQQYGQQQGDGEQQQQQPPSLLITGDMEAEMRRATTDFAGGIDFLALARQRAAERKQSVNNASSTADWANLAEEKLRASGGVVEDEWEASLADEGNVRDAAGLGISVPLEEGGGGTMVTESGLVIDGQNPQGGNGDDEEGPGLLLF